ncbi:hypothetical protein JMUB7535_26900 [Staphylococcus aureus]
MSRGLGDVYKRQSDEDKTNRRRRKSTFNYRNLEFRKAKLLFKTLVLTNCLLYTSPSPRDMRRSRMPSSA